MRRHRILGALGSCLCVTALLTGAPARASSQSGVVLSPVSVHLNPTTFGTVQFMQGSKQGCLVGTLPKGALAVTGGYRQIKRDTRFGRVVARRGHGRASVSVPLAVFNVDPAPRGPAGRIDVVPWVAATMFTLILQRRTSGGAWSTLSAATTDAKGVARWSFPAASADAYRIAFAGSSRDWSARTAAFAL